MCNRNSSNITLFKYLMITKIIYLDKLQIVHSNTHFYPLIQVIISAEKILKKIYLLLKIKDNKTSLPINFNNLNHILIFLIST